MHEGYLIEGCCFYDAKWSYYYFTAFLFGEAVLLFVCDLLLATHQQELHHTFLILFSMSDSLFSLSVAIRVVSIRLAPAPC